MASAMIDRAELPVQRNKTLNGRSVTTGPLCTRSSGAPRALANLGFAEFRTALAAMIGEIRHECIHRRELRRIDHRAAVAARCDETRLAQSIKMKGQRIGRQSQAGADM